MNFNFLYQKNFYVCVIDYNIDFFKETKPIKFVKQKRIPAIVEQIELLKRKIL